MYNCFYLIGVSLLEIVMGTFVILLFICNGIYLIILSSQPIFDASVICGHTKHILLAIYTKFFSEESRASEAVMKMG